MDRRHALAALVALGASAVPVRAPGQSARRIGYIVISPLVDPPSPERAAFLAGLHELGYFGDAAIRIEYRSANNDRAKLHALADELARSNAEMIVATSTPVAIAAAQATSKVPIVLAGVGDARETGLVSNYARPEGNVTGVTWNTIELAGKGFQMLRELLPRGERVALIHNPEDAITRHIYPISRAVSARLGFHPIGVPVSNVATLQAAIEQIERTRPDAIEVLVDALLVTYRRIIADEALRLKIPCMSSYHRFVDVGALMSYAADLDALYRRAAYYVDRILKGATPRELPIEEPAKYLLVLNLGTARAIGVTFPQSLLLRANRVIE